MWYYFLNEILEKGLIELLSNGFRRGPRVSCPPETVAVFISGVLSTVFAIYFVFVLAYPGTYPITKIGETGLMPAIAWMAYYLVFKLYQKRSLMRYFGTCFGLSVLGIGSCYAAFRVSGLPVESFLWAIAALCNAFTWFGAAAALSFFVWFVQGGSRHKHF